MNIFAVNNDPYLSAYQLPDKHVVKMPLETCQMLSIVYSDWYHSIGQIFKSDGTPYKTEKGAFRNHPCTKWVAESNHNIAWLIEHGIALCEEYTYRYDKKHGCEESIRFAAAIAPEGCSARHTPFARAMPDKWKFNYDIPTTLAYRRYVASKPWAPTNYLRKPERRPVWIVSTNSGIADFILV
mgnify:FL=1|tara:strand:+ start:10222 stop:10770 length:549 start_codon:yes stop_codon:yes gene_type:complete